MGIFVQNSILFIVFASVAYYFDMPAVTIFGFGFWVAMFILANLDSQYTIEEMIQKINFLLRGDADYVKDAKEKIEKLEREVSDLRYELEDRLHQTQEDLKTISKALTRFVRESKSKEHYRNSKSPEDKFRVVLSYYVNETTPYVDESSLELRHERFRDFTFAGIDGTKFKVKMRDASNIEAELNYIDAFNTVSQDEYDLEFIEEDNTLLYKKYVSFLESWDFESIDALNTIKHGTYPIRITEDEFVISVKSGSIDDNIEDTIYKKVMEEFDRKVDFKIEGDIYDKKKKNKYREDYILYKNNYRDELALGLKGEKDASKIWNAFLIYMARGSIVVEGELQTKVFLDKVINHHWHISAYSESLPSYIDVQKEFKDFFGEHVEVIFTKKENNK